MARYTVEVHDAVDPAVVQGSLNRVAATLSSGRNVMSIGLPAGLQGGRPAELALRVQADVDRMLLLDTAEPAQRAEMEAERCRLAREAEIPGELLDALMESIGANPWVDRGGLNVCRFCMAARSHESDCWWLRAEAALAEVGAEALGVPVGSV